MSNNDTTSSEINTNALHQCDLTLSITSLSVSVDITTILSWVISELDENYMQHGTLTTIRNLDTDWQDGRAFLCLAHRFYPNSIPLATFYSLLEQDDDALNAANTLETRSSLAFFVFEKELSLAPPTLTDPHTPIPLYIAKVRQALLSTSQPSAINDNTDIDDSWAQRTDAVLSTIQHIRHLLIELDFRPSSQDDISGANHTTSTLTHEKLSDVDPALPHSDNTKGDTRAKTTSTGTNSWQDDLDTIEQRLIDLQRLKDEYHTWADNNIDIVEGAPDSAVPTQLEKRRRLALIQSVDNAHLSLQEYLEHGQQVLAVFRKRALLTQATAPIRHDLDWVQAEMLKTTTTDTGIKELESHVQHAGELLDQLIQQYSEHQQPPNTSEPLDIQPIVDGDDDNNNSNNDTDQQQQRLYMMEVKALEKKYKLVQSWVEDIRVWFVEAQRIRKWIGERIGLLENSDVPDGVLVEHLTLTADHVEDLNTSHEALEKDVELFDKQDMSRLRTHVKDLTVVGTKEKELSPADTTTIEITFTTLMTLDRLMHLLNRRSYDLQVLTLRVFWENEFFKTETWVHTLADELSTFIASQARWQAVDGDLQHSDDPNERKTIMAALLSQSPSLKSVVIDKLLEFETDISTFDQGQFTTTVNLYQELDDTSKVELPNFLESRQVGVEESFEQLVHRTTFARHVVEQYLTMVDFMDTSGNLLYCYGYDLHEKLLQHTGKVYSLFLDQRNGYDPNDGFPTAANGVIDHGLLEDQPLVDENAYFQEYAVRLITDTASLIPYTETEHPLDQQENETGNQRVHQAVKSRSSELILYGESLELDLSHYQKAIRWHGRLNDVYDEIQRIHNEIINDISSANEVSNTLINTFGDQVSALSSEWIHDKKSADNWNLNLQQHVDNISTYETGLGVVDDHMQSLLDLYELPLSTRLDSHVIPTAVADTVKYLEAGADLASSHLQKLASTLDQWKSGLSMMKCRQSWESQYSITTEWMATHEQKCRHIRSASAWLPTSQNVATHQQMDQNRDLVIAASTLEQEWGVFKNQSLSSLAKSFEKLVKYSSGSAEEKTWTAQRQRQKGVMSGAEQIDGMLALARTLLDQRMAITQFLDGAARIHSQGTQRLNHLKWIITKIDRNGTAISADNGQWATVDAYNNLVLDLWQKWQSFDNHAVTGSIGAAQEGLDMDLEQQCAKVELHASVQHDILLTLGDSLRDWDEMVKVTNDLRHDVKIWCEKVETLDVRVGDFYKALESERNTLLQSLAKNYVPAMDGNNKFGDGNLAVNYANQRVKEMDCLLQQWRDHDIDSLHEVGLTLNNRIQHLMKTLLELTHGEDGNWSLDVVGDTKRTDIQLDKLRSRVATVIQPILSLVLNLAETSDKRCSWELIYANMSLILQQLRVRLDDVELDKQRWLTANDGNHSVAPLHDLLDKVKMIAMEFNNIIYSSGSCGLSDIENNIYANMVKSYHSLTTNDIDPYTVQLPFDLELKHDQCQQSMQHIETTAKRLDEDINWLETGAIWLHYAGEQFETWKVLMGDLDHFIEHDAKWSIDISCGDARSQMHLSTTLLELQQRVDDLICNIGSASDKLHDWKCIPSADGVDSMSEFDVWNQNASQLENCQADATDYMEYVSTLVNQQIKLQVWSNSANQAKLLGEQAKVAMLRDHDNDVEVAGEPLQLLAAFDAKLAHVLDCAQNVNYPTHPPLLAWKSSSTLSAGNLEDTNGSDHDPDLTIRQHIQSRHEDLNNLSISLNGILSANERSIRLKSLVEGYVSKALESLHWINSTDNKLQQLVPDYSDLAIGWEDLNSRLDMINELEHSTNEYTDTHYHVLKDSANHCITSIQFDAEDLEQLINNSSRVAQLDRVSSLQQQVENEWQRLFNSIQHYSRDLEKQRRQAERSDGCRKVLEKCQTINDQFDNATIDHLTDDQLNLWRHDISSVKTTELHHLRNLFATDDVENLDMTTQSILDKATMACQQLGNRLQVISDDFDLRHRKLKHNELAVSLIGFTSSMKPKLMELHSSLDTLPVQLSKEADDAFYGQLKERLDSVANDVGCYEDVYTQEGELFLSICDDNGEGDSNALEMINEQHRKVEIGWAELQQQTLLVENRYDLIVKRRSVFDALYLVSSLLDNIDTSLNGVNEPDIDAAQKDIDRAKMLLAEADSSANEHNCSMIPSPGDKNDVFTSLDIIYQQRYDKLLEQMGTVENRMEHRQKQQRLQQLHQQHQGKMDAISTLAQGELSALESLRLQNSKLPERAVFDPLSGTQQYQQWLKQVESIERVLQKLTRDSSTLVTAASTIGLENGAVDEIGTRSQPIFSKLKEELEYEKSSLDLARRILGLGKSANNITSWLTHFEQAVDGISGDDMVAAKSYDEKSMQVLDDKINGLHAKLRGFEPIMASLDKMNSVIQDLSQVDGVDDIIKPQWKQSARNRFDQVNVQWRNCLDKMESAKRMAGKAKQSAIVNHKIGSMVTFLDDIRHQVEQLQINTFLVESTNSSSINNYQDQDQVQQSQLDIKKLPRDRDIVSAEELLATLKRRLTTKGRPQRTEIDQLVEHYSSDQQIDGVDGTRFVEQRNEIDAIWTNIVGTIDNTKRLLAKKKVSGRYLSLVDDIDLLLDSMDEVLLKADPLYNETSNDSKSSKTELHAKLIELNARYNYYSINIQQNLQRADEAWAALLTDNGDDMYQQKPALENYLLGQQTRWNSMVNQQVPSRQLELKKIMEQQIVNTEKKSRQRKTSLPTRKAPGTLSPNSRPRKPVLATSSSSSIRSSTEPRDGYRRLRTVSSTSMLTSNKRPASQQGSLSTSTASMKASDTGLSVASSTKKRSPTPTTAKKRPNSYVAQTGNDLDMEIGRIVNDTPYRIKVKMVPGEVGRYWFGDINPKLVYCRVLKSKMVMVRVGGGWTELSQFLRDHALLEGELIIPKKQNQLHTSIQEGYLEATTSLQRQRQQLLQQHLEQFRQQSQYSMSSTTTSSPHSYLLPRTPIPTMKTSISTPPNKSDVLRQKGYKDGDKFFAVDRHGNQLEVKMTRFRQQEALPVSTTNRRRKLVKS